jgi:hypothetical protein
MNGDHFEKGAAIPGDELAWRRFAAHAHFSRLAPALRNAKTRVEYTRVALASALRGEVMPQTPEFARAELEYHYDQRIQTYTADMRRANLAKARAARAAKKAAKEA